MFHHVQSPGIEAIGKWIIDQPIRHAQHIWAMDLLHPKALQRTEVIDVPQFAPQFLKNFPVPVASGGAICLCQVVLEIILYAIVVEKRIVDVKQEHDSRRFGHRDLLCFWCLSFRPSEPTRRRTRRAYAAPDNVSALLALPEELLCNLRHTLGFELEFSQELLQGSRRAECLHSDDAVGPPSNVAFPAKR